MLPSAPRREALLRLCITLSQLILVTYEMPEEPPTECQRTPTETTAARSEGSNGLHLDIFSHPKNDTFVPSGYIPGEMYTVVLEGFRTKYTEQTFRGFTIVAVSAEDPKRFVGTFKLHEGNTDVRMSERCPAGVTHTTLYPKTRIEILWQAPPNNEGCIAFKAMVLEYRDIWYMDEGPLTKKFCQIIGYEDVMPDDAADECCACDEAKYELVFDGHWSRQTHPKDYPTIEQLTHFSDLIGGSHSSKFVMWKMGGYATDGLKELAEWGNTVQMEEEMKDIGKEIRTIVKARGLWFPDVQSSTRAVFRTDQYHHLFSLASMLGPSPDWCVGISRINLCKKDCTWADKRKFELYPWDAGTDSGTTYMSPNNPSLPRETIKPITTKTPSGSPFYNPKSDIMPPLATLYLRRQKVYKMECKNASYYEGLSIKQSETSEDLLYKNRPECAVGGWSPWSSCAATCGKGIRIRSRSYKRAFKAQVKGCRRQLLERQFCSAPLPECYGSDVFNDMCTTTQWSGWTQCSVSCGSGTRSRTRQYAATMAIKACSSQLVDKETCDGAYGKNCDVTPDPRCQMTAWSEWSPCSVSCGEGTRVRTRLLYKKENIEVCQDQSFMEKESCTAVYKNCAEIIYQHKEEICVEPMEPGECQGVFPRYYYDAGERKCKRFIYNGCKGNRNNFESAHQCQTACITGPSESPTQQSSVPVDHLAIALGLNDEDDPSPRDCMMTDWSVWSDCTATCGRAKRTRTRVIRLPAKNGGQPCPPSRTETRHCRLKPCRYSCEMTPWSQWSPCSVSCGTGVQRRLRKLRNPSRHTRNRCGRRRLRRRICFTGVKCR